MICRGMLHLVFLINIPLWELNTLNIHPNIRGTIWCRLCSTLSILCSIELNGHHQVALNTNIRRNIREEPRFHPFWFCAQCTNQVASRKVQPHLSNISKRKLQFPSFFRLSLLKDPPLTNFFSFSASDFARSKAWISDSTLRLILVCMNPSEHW